MKKILFLSTFLSVGLLLSQGIGDPVTIPFQWDVVPQPGVVHYRLYHSDSGGLGSISTGQDWHTAFTEVDRVDHPTINGDHQLTIDNQEHWYVVTAVNQIGLESDPSNEVTLWVTPKPDAPGSFDRQDVIINVSTQIETGDGFDTGIRLSVVDPADIKVDYYKNGQLLKSETMELPQHSTTAYMIKGNKQIEPDLVTVQSDIPFAATAIMVHKQGNRVEYLSFPFVRVE